MFKSIFILYFNEIMYINKLHGKRIYKQMYANESKRSKKIIVMQYNLNLMLYLFQDYCKQQILNEIKQ